MATVAFSLTFWTKEDGKNPVRGGTATFTDADLEKIAKATEKLYTALGPGEAPYEFTMTVGRSSYGWSADEKYSAEIADVIWAKYLALAAFADVRD